MGKCYLICPHKIALTNLTGAVLLLLHALIEFSGKYVCDLLICAHILPKAYAKIIDLAIDCEIEPEHFYWFQ